MKKIAVYAGSFDPITLGHLDVLQKVRGLFDTVYLLIADNPKKKPLLSVEERLDLITEALADSKLSTYVRVDSTQGLVVDFCGKIGATHLLRGLRAVSDFDGEFALTLMNRRLDERLTTIHIMADEKYFFLSSSLVKEVAAFGRTIDEFVPKCVARAISKKYKSAKSSKR